MEQSADVEEFLALDREFHLSCYDRAPTTRARRDRAAALEPHAALPPRVHAPVRAPTADRSVHHEHHLLVSAIRRRDLDEAERVLAGHIRRTRLELARHPDVFD